MPRFIRKRAPGSGNAGQIAVAAIVALGSACLAGSPLYLSSVATGALRSELSHLCLADVGLRIPMGGVQPDRISRLDDLAAPLAAHTQPSVLTRILPGISLDNGRSGVRPFQVNLVYRDGQEQNLPATGEAPRQRASAGARMDEPAPGHRCGRQAPVVRDRPRRSDRLRADGRGRRHVPAHSDPAGVTVLVRVAQLPAIVGRRPCRLSDTHAAVDVPRPARRSGLPDHRMGAAARPGRAHPPRRGGAGRSFRLHRPRRRSPRRRQRAADRPYGHRW